MSGKVYLIAWLTIEWLATGLLAAAIFFMFFTDVHGLPTAGWTICLAVFGLATVGYVVALRYVSSLRVDR
ncbi:MAG TPA: hypothetical protein VM308_10095 [Sphingomicrobium sp.]|nr:hypothetical protein [Sphingomicrobium sp.]